MLWADHVAKNTARGRDDVFEEVRRRFSAAELVELTGICGVFAVSNRFQDSLHLPIEEQHDVDRIRQSVRVDPARIKAYIEKLIEFWPRAFPAPECRAPAAVRGGAAAAGGTARVPLLDPAGATGEAARFFHAAGELLGGLSNAVRVWAHVPYVGKLFLPFQIVLEREGAGGALPSALKLMALVRTAHINDAPYSLAHRTALARAAGVTEDELAALRTAECLASPLFTARERAALLWAGHVASNTAKRREDVFGVVEAQFSHAEVVELTAACACANMTDRIHNALHVPVEPDAGISALYPAVRFEHDRLRAYLETLIANWPDEFPVPDAGAPAG